MNIILEGPDAIGKSTLAEKLKNKYGMSIVNSTSKTRNDFYYHIDLLDYRENTVFDRFHVGEMVYPEIYGRECKLSLDDFISINKRIVDNHDMIIIFYTSDINILKERLIERGELNYLEEIEQQNKLFLKWASIIDVHDYKLFKLVDIAKDSAYDALDNWIDRYFNETNVNIAYRKVCRDLIEKGHIMETSNIRGNTRELCNYSFTIDDINSGLITLKTGKCNLNYIAGETLWYWNSRNDVEFISKFSTLWSKLSDDGITNNSAYGYILQEKYGFNQIETIINLLNKDKYSRRAVLNLNVPNPWVIDTKDEICTICLIYQIRDNKLHCTCVMRSNDVKFGTRNDLGYFLMLQRYIADRLNVDYGTYTHFAASIHVYDRDYDFVKNVAYGTMETEDYTIDFDRLIYNNDFLIDYIDNKWVNKEEFTNLLKEKGIIYYYK